MQNETDNPQGAQPSSRPFIVFPAVDLRGGQVVRLKEGDPNRQTRYAASPAETARRWLDAGARWLHVVNLDGAFGENTRTNMEALRAVLAAAGQRGAPVQFGGGLRSLEAIQAAIDLGVRRVMLGTAVVEDPAVLESALSRWGAERVGVSLDAREGLVQVRGWQSSTAIRAAGLAKALGDKGLRWLVYTDIARDGLQTGINLAETTALAGESGLNVIASGGASRLVDVTAARDAGLSGIIVGRALYEEAVNPRALFALSREE